MAMAEISAVSNMPAGLRQVYENRLRTWLAKKEQHSKRKKAVGNLAGILIGLLVVMIVASIAVLIGGIFDATTQKTFQDTGLNNTEWDQLRENTASYTRQGISIAIIGVIIAAAVGILGIVMMLQRGGLF